MRPPPQPTGAQPEVSASQPPWLFVVGSAILALFVFYCYWPLTHFFFSQDDFYFLERASSGFRASMEQYFTTRPGHFRPLTRGLYFLAAWPLFELNAFPYHVVSLVLHAVNSILAGVVLRRFGVSVRMSWIAAFLFAANVANLEAVAWISCVQQLLSTTFALAALIWGVDAIATRSRSRMLAASIAYLLALGSDEQTLALPLVLILWVWSQHGERRALRELVFGCTTFALLLAPVLFIHHHVFSFHLYLPAIGAWYLIATAADSLVRVVPAFWRRPAVVTVVCAVVLAAAGSSVAVKRNTTNYVSDDVKLPRVRVLRRAVLAEQVCNDVSERWHRGPRLSLVYAGRAEPGNWDDIKYALHDGDALRLVLLQPALEVDFLLPSQVSGIPPDQIMVVTELGETLTIDQYRVLARYRPLAWRFTETTPAQP